MRLPNKGDWELVAWVVAGALLFSAATAAAPATYHYAQPAEHYYNVQQVHVEVDEQDPCTLHTTTTSWARYQTDLTVEAVLYNVEDANGSSVEKRIVEEWVYQATVPDGLYNVERERGLDQPLDAGVYKYEFVVRFDAPHGWDKHVEQDSERFGVHHGGENVSAVFPEAGEVATYPDSARCAG